MAVLTADLKVGRKEYLLVGYSGEWMVARRVVPRAVRTVHPTAEMLARCSVVMKDDQMVALTVALMDYHLVECSAQG